MNGPAALLRPERWSNPVGVRWCIEQIFRSDRQSYRRPMLLMEARH
jgi:hypothetical protein